MNVFQTIAAAAVATFALSASAVTAEAPMEDSVSLLEHISFNGNALYVKVYPPTSTLRCYNVYRCFNDRASSAYWNIYFEGTVVFHTDKDCTGQSREWPTQLNFYPYNFGLDGINDAVSSFHIGGQDVITRIEYVDACPFAPLQVDNATIVASDKTASVTKSSV